MRKLLVPEVVQTSNMDCGPAALKCLLEGFHIPVSYGRLREACQTGIDGTSIDTMETVANQLGLEAEQIMLPPDHLLLPEANALPALVVVRLPNGLTHFVVIWRRHGNLLQVMDPSVGRRWVSANRFLNEVYSHVMPVGAMDWMEFAKSDDSVKVLGARLARAHLPKRGVEQLIKAAVESTDWKRIAALGAGTRLLTTLNRAGAVHRGSDRLRLLEKLSNCSELIPERYWPVRAVQSDSVDSGDQQLLMRGAVLVRVRGKRKGEAPQDLGPELRAAIHEKPLSPGRELIGALWKSGSAACGLLLIALALAAGATIFEALLFRGLFDLTAELGLTGQRIGAIAAIILFSAILLLLEFPLFAMACRLGRQVENRLRMAFFAKIPKLGDRYFQSRLTSDMAERSHSARRLRDLPHQARELLRAVFQLCATAAGIIWLEPRAAPFVIAVAVMALAPTLAAQAVLAERDLRVRSHAAGLTRFYLDSMLGLLAIRAHGSQRSVRREHEKLLGEWAVAALHLQKTAVFLEAAQLVITFGLVAAMLLTHPFTGAEIGRVLLVVYWALNLPVLGQDIGTLMRQYPYYRNLTLRLLDPLGAPEEATGAADNAPEIANAPAISFCGVSVDISGHPILTEIDFRIDAGAHVAIVGPSGAGKSSIVSVLLGWLRPTQGTALVDDAPLNCERLRAATAWVDPAVQLWNRSLLANLSYGGRPDPSGMAKAIDAALLRTVLETLPEGLQTRLGEGGALVSGGEGQRVRLARALLRENVQFAILDEPFRGLDREKRRELLKRARDFWRDSTMLCITHDLSETRVFDRVLVIESGRVVEDGHPEELAADPKSRYAELLDAEEQTRTGLWSGDLWRRIRIQAGRILEELPKHIEEKAASDETREEVA